MFLKYFLKNHQIIHIGTKRCLTTEGWMLIIAPCELNDDKQKWNISSFEEYKNVQLFNANKMESEIPQ